MNNTLKHEKAIIAECKKDIKAFRKIYKKYLEDIFRYVYVVVRDKDLAEDITSQTFLTAIEKVEKFEWRGISIKHWLIKIAKNLIKKNLSRPKEISLDESMIGLEKLDRKMLEDLVIEEELKEKVKELIFKLDDVTREIISLRIWEELKFREIAEILDMKQVTVKVRFMRGVERLKQMIQKQAQEEKKKKLLAVSFAMIVVGMKSIKTMVDFLPSIGFKNSLTAQVASKLSLDVSDITMNNLGKVSNAKKMAKAVIAGPKGLKVAIAVLGAIAILTSASLVSYAIIKNMQVEEASVSEKSVEEETQQEDAQEDTTEETEETTETEEAVEDEEPEDPYAGWKTYVFSALGISIKVPGDWKYTGMYGKPAEPEASATEVQFVTPDGTKPLSIQYYPGPYGWCEEDTPQGPVQHNSPWEPITIGGAEFKISWCDNAFMITQDWGIYQEGNLEFDGIKEYQDIQIIEDVLSTVKFL